MRQIINKFGRGGGLQLSREIFKARKTARKHCEAFRERAMHILGEDNSFLTPPCRYQWKAVFNASSEVRNEELNRDQQRLQKNDQPRLSPEAINRDNFSEINDRREFPRN